MPFGWSEEREPPVEPPICGSCGKLELMYLKHSHLLKNRHVLGINQSKSCLGLVETALPDMVLPMSAIRSDAQF